MEHKLKGIKVKKEALEAIASTANARNIPPYDLEADVVEMAYPLDKIILKGEWDYLQDIFELMQGGSELTTDVYPSFVCNRVHNLQKAKVRILEVLNSFGWFVLQLVIFNVEFFLTR